MQGPSPLLGYNTNVRHAGKLFHIQTEDSGINRPHIITHLFADGGRIIASSKTSYAEHVGEDDLRVTVKKLMQAQHKAMFIALRDGVYDDDPAEAPQAEPEPVPAAAPEPAQAPEPAPAQAAEPEAARSISAAPAPAPLLSPPPSAPPGAFGDGPPTAPQPVDVDALERAAHRIGTQSSAPGAAETLVDGPGRYQSTQPAAEVLSHGKSSPPSSIFGSDLLSEKSLDEVILSYLSEDLDDSTEAG